ncbi:MAG TPA: 2-oxoacid:acceptor oxidoreductase family protein, partial [Candidatus Sumerlaeota bacterium]|nr:2-oxoacid:acceptor oxidoreductase family protein [Candidatus Sumerlaeota bacterium]
GVILGKAASIYDGLFATLTHSYGPEARGGLCSAQIIISDSRIAYPYTISPDAMVFMSQESWERFSQERRPDTIIISESEIVGLPEPLRDEAWSIPALRIAEELGSSIVLNMVMLGFITAVTKVLSVDAMLKAISQTVPPGTEPMNILAFNRGHDFGKALISERELIAGSS